MPGPAHHLFSSRRALVLLALCVYALAILAAFLFTDATLIFFIVLVIAAVSWGYGTRYGLLCILLSIPLHGALVAEVYQDWSYFWWTFSLGGRGMQIITALLFGRLRAAQVQLAHKQHELEARNAELQFMLGHVKELRGLLPICAGCKSIRDDQGYWTKLEAYIHQHSHAQLTHGMCPNCINKLFPDLDHT